MRNDPEGTIVLFRAKEDKKESEADLQGKVKIGGLEYMVSLWETKAKKGDLVFYKGKATCLEQFRPPPVPTLGSQPQYPYYGAPPQVLNPQMTPLPPMIYQNGTWTVLPVPAPAEAHEQPSAP